jgi:UDP-N-acetylmuramoyl-L-alanyl-D-glutamate--2,6-diaminopimelate ligase
VAGRFERVDEGQPFLAAVDYAHTPDGLEKLLLAARELAGEGRVIVVFGAGGDRDPSKRPEMGAVVARLADVAIVTTDNPRHEDPAAIMAAVQSGMTDQALHERALHGGALDRGALDRGAGEEDDRPAGAAVHAVPDRREAIVLATRFAVTGDVLLVAGKGHETTQVVGDEELPFDDREVLRDALRALRTPGPRSGPEGGDR